MGVLPDVRGLNGTDVFENTKILIELEKRASQFNGPGGDLFPRHHIKWPRANFRAEYASISTNAEGQPVIHYTNVYRAFAKWAHDGSLWQAFLASVRHLAVEKHLDLSVLPGDGTNTVAKKGATGWGTRGTNTRRGRRSSPSRTTTAMCELRCPSHPSTRPIWCCYQR